MKVTHVSIRPAEAAEHAGRPALTPELLAASGARYSRNNEGLDSILSRIDPCNLDRSVDGIFRMIDYGHQSIADMVPVSMFIDGVSLWLAYYIWTLCPTAGGQESSTRYIRLSRDETIAPDLLGIADDKKAEWERFVDESLGAYQESLEAWERLAAQNPEAARIPRRLLDDSSDRAARQVARMRRNYGFDRARTFLPASVSTNLMLIMSARAWVQVCQHLLSYPLPEAKLLGQALREELSLAAPRMLRHATETASIVNGIRREFESLSADARAHPPACLADPLSDDGAIDTGLTDTGLIDAGLIDAGTIGAECPSVPTLEVFPPQGVDPADLAADLQFHDNRYAWLGSDIRRTLVRFRWEAITFAEIRDLNRHRTGTRFCPLRPRGFYAAQDELPASTGVETRHRFTELARRGKAASARAHEMLCAGEPGYVYWALLGTQYPFEHSTTADKFLYEAELRTGAGAHYRYARHLRDMLELWYRQFPETLGLVLEGSAEPE